MADIILNLIKFFAIMLSVYFLLYAFSPWLPFGDKTEEVKKGATICAIIVIFLIIAHIIITF